VRVKITLAERGPAEVLEFAADPDAFVCRCPAERFQLVVTAGPGTNPVTLHPVLHGSIHREDAGRWGAVLEALGKAVAAFGRADLLEYETDGEAERWVGPGGKTVHVGEVGC